MYIIIAIFLLLALDRCFFNATPRGDSATAADCILSDPMGNNASQVLCLGCFGHESPPLLDGTAADKACEHAAPTTTVLTVTPLMKRVSQSRNAPLNEEEQAQVKAIDELFDTIDKNGDGCVSKRELKSAIKAEGHTGLGARLGLKRVKDVDGWMKSADLDRDGVIDRYEFHQWMENNPPP